MHIYDKQIGNKSKAHLGSTYEQPQGYTTAYMGGSNTFTIKEIEVFAISFK
jgi:hypothetical protein